MNATEQAKVKEVIEKLNSARIYVDASPYLVSTAPDVKPCIGMLEALIGKKPTREKPKSRSDRWSEAASEAVAALQDLRDVQTEYEEWRDNLPENLQQSVLGEKLESVCDLEIESALDTASEAEGIDLPQGFGRD